MTKNAEPIMKEYKASSSATRKETRRVLDATLLEVDPQSLEGQVLAYLVGRFDEIDEVSKSRGQGNRNIETGS